MSSPPLPRTFAQPASLVTRSSATPGSRVPWFLWTGVAALTSAWIGGSWDVAWHRSIGRDSFWTPAHLLIQLCAILAGIVGVALVYRGSFGKSRTDGQLQAASVHLLGLRAPLGVFMAGWGGVAMLTSAPFDNWWHNAYGLDVEIISPPHVLLILGIRVISIGFLFLTLAALNRAEAAHDAVAKPLRNIFLYMGSLVVLGQMFFLQELTDTMFLHSAGAYISIAIAVPVVFAAFSETSGSRWTATILAGMYCILTILEILIFPLFPAHPKLGPVMYPVTHLVPTSFPILIVAPALAFDLVWQRARTWKLWQMAVIGGILFVVVLVAVQWPFADFLQTSHAANRFFGTEYFDYGTGPKNPDRLHLFWKPQHGLVLLRGFGIAAACAALSTWLGLLFGRWAKQVQR